MKLYITRHGETMRNAEQRILGRTDDPLSEKGKQQAAELAEKMKDIDIDLIFTSPLSRAKETAQRIADVKGMSLIVDDRLIETNFGDFEGRPRNLEAYHAYSGKTAHPFQRNGAPFRLKLSKAQIVN